MQNNRRAFTIIELMIACAILLISISVIFVNLKMSNQTSEREAEKVLAWINKLTQKANKTHQAFTLGIDSTNNILKMYWNNESADANTVDESLNATSGCKYEPYTNTSSFTYTLNNIYEPSGTIIITGSDESKYIVLSSQGRARISNTYTSDDNNDNDY